MAIRIPKTLRFLDVLQTKWQHFGERIAASGYALLAIFTGKPTTINEKYAIL